MLSISTWHPPSAVSHSLRCNVVSDSVETLVVAKINRLEVYDTTATGLELRCKLDTWGTVTSLLSTRRKSKKADSLIVTTDHPDPKLYVIDYDSGAVELNVVHSLSLSLRTRREAEMFNGAIIHPNGRVIVCCQYSGTVKVIVLGEGSAVIQTEFECRIPELNIHTLCFVPTAGSKIILGVLSEDYNGRKHVVARELKVEEAELLYEQSHAIQGGFVQNGATALIPVAGQRKTPGVLVLGGEGGHFFGSEKASSKRASTGDRLTSVNSLAKFDIALVSPISFTEVDDNRFIVGDSIGQLYMLSVQRNGPGNSVSAVAVLELGQCSPVASITHISGAVFYIGSLVGDSQIIRLVAEKKSNDKYFDVLQEHTNIGPISDAVLLDVDSSGQSQVVTCSGASTTGSLRVIRSGAEFRRSATLETFPNVDKLFPLRPSFESKTDSILLISTPFSTAVTDVGELSLSELDAATYPGFSRSQRTLAACTLEYRGRAVQVTTDSIHLVDMVSGMQIESWPANGMPERIAVAAVNPTQICIGLKGGKLILFSTKSGQLKVTSEKQPELVDGLPNEVSAISIDPYTSSTATSSNFAAVSYYATNTISLFKLPGFSTAFRPVTEPHVPRSLLLHSFGGPTDAFLFAGLGDGTVVAYSVTNDGLATRRANSLGTQLSVTLTRCNFETGNGEKVVLAAGSRSSVLWYDMKTRRLRNSAVSIKDTVGLCAIDHEAYPGSVLIASRSSMTLGSIGELNKLNIRTIPFGSDNPREISHLEDHNALVVGCLKSDTDPKTGAITEASSIKILDATTFERVTQIACMQTETITCVAVLELGHGGDLSSFAVVGTAFTPPEGSIEAQRGRILVISGADARSQSIVASLDVTGCVYGVVGLNGRLAAVVNSATYVYDLQKPSQDDSGYSIVQKAKWDRGYILTSVVSRGNNLIVVDALKSVSWLQLRGDKLLCVAQNYEALWPLSAQFTDATSIICGELDHNIALFHRSESELERVGGLHFGELVNRFILGSLTPASPESAVRPEMIAVTPTGRISVISQIDEETSMRLTGLQRNMENISKGPGGLELTKYRTPRTARGAHIFAGFIDGDFVDKFLDLSDADVRRVISGRNEFERLEGDKQDILQLVEQVTAMN